MNITNFIEKFKKTKDFLYKKIQNIKELKIFIKPFLILAVIYIIAFSAIIRANFLYIDDLGRTFNGYKDWDGFSRYTSNFLSTIIHCGNYLTEISPLTQIIAIVFLSISGIIILYVLTKKHNFTFWEYTSVAILGLSPYFLECISYKYDSPYMALSILASVFPMLFYNKKYISFIIVTMLSIIIVCTTYQASLGIFPMFVIIMAFIMWSRKDNLKDIIKFIGYALIGYLLGVIIFKLFIMTSINIYVSSNISTDIKLIIENYKKFFGYIKSDFKPEWILLIFILYLSFIYKSVRNSEQNKFLTFIISLFMIIILNCICFGLYPLLEKPLFNPRAMYGFGVCISLLATYLAISDKFIIGKLISTLIFWVFFVFAFTYGNALYQQQEYTDFRIELVINDLIDNDLLSADKTKNFRIIGDIGEAPALRNIPKDCGILSRLIPTTFGDSTWKWAVKKFRDYYGMKNIKIDNNISKELPIIESNIYHTIKANETDILIELNP